MITITVAALEHLPHLDQTTVNHKLDLYQVHPWDVPCNATKTTKKSSWFKILILYQYEDFQVN